jgi:hypothetical protein
MIYRDFSFRYVITFSNICYNIIIIIKNVIKINIHLNDTHNNAAYKYLDAFLITEVEFMPHYNRLRQFLQHIISCSPSQRAAICGTPCSDLQNERKLN